MGNAMGMRGRRSVKVMTVDGATFKLRPPCSVRDALSGRGDDYSVMESDDVKRNGVNARRLDLDVSLKPGKLYFLVLLPKPNPPRRPLSSSTTDPDQDPRPVRSTINMSAKDRLETLMLARRAASDISGMSRVAAVEENNRNASSGVISEGVRVKMRLPRAEVARIVKESADSAEAAKKIAALARSKINEASSSGSEAASPQDVSGCLSGNLSDSGNLVTGGPAVGRKKKMRFSPLQPEILG